MARIEAARPRMAAMAREHYGIDMMPGRVNNTSRDSLIGEKIAAAAGLGNEFHHALMEAYWQEEKDIADREVLARVAAAIGMDRADFLEKLDDPEMEQAVLADIMSARQYGLSGVPAMIINQKCLISGAQPYEALVNALEQVALAEAEA
jgi:predicted DsbA family dithiol-disulfide isomerase